MKRTGQDTFIDSPPSRQGDVECTTFYHGKRILWPLSNYEEVQLVSIAILVKLNLA